eukprot:6586995-Prymnesium_polylepis.1
MRLPPAHSDAAHAACHGACVVAKLVDARAKRRAKFCSADFRSGPSGKPRSPGPTLWRYERPLTLERMMYTLLLQPKPPKLTAVHTLHMMLEK